MKNSATSGRVTRAACTADRNVCTNVSRYLLRTVGRWTSSAPLYSRQPPVDDVRAAVDDDLVAARGQPGGELLDGGLEAAVGGGDAARAEDRDLHRLPARE